MTSFFNRLKSFFTPVNPRRGAAARTGRQWSCRPQLEVLEDRHVPASLQISGAFNMDYGDGYLADIVGYDNSFTANVALDVIYYDYADFGWERYESIFSGSGAAVFEFSGPDADLLNAKFGPGTQLYFESTAYPSPGLAGWCPAGWFMEATSFESGVSLRVYGSGTACVGSSGNTESVWGSSSFSLDVYGSGSAGSDWDNSTSVNIVRDPLPPPPSPPPAIRISNANAWVQEGNSGTTPAVFTVSLSAASDQMVEVYYTTLDSDATVADNDYQAASGCLSFEPGETTKTFTVLVNGDRRGERTEDFGVRLYSPINAYIDEGQDTSFGRIFDDEPAIAISDVSLKEGRSGARAFVFTVSLSVAYDVPVTINFATRDGKATTADNDYQATSGTLVFAPGETSKTITVWVNGDRKKEAHETFFIDLWGADFALIADGAGTGTILNDDR